MEQGFGRNRLSVFMPKSLPSFPTVVGIELSRSGSNFIRCLSQVLLEHHTVLVKDERHDAGIAIPCGIGENSESPRHLAVDHVVLRATFRLRPLFVQHDKVVAVEGLMLLGLNFISFRSGIGDKWSQRTPGLI